LDKIAARMWINGIKRLPIRRLEAYYPVSLFITYFPILSIYLGLEAALRLFAFAVS